MKRLLLILAAALAAAGLAGCATGYLLDNQVQSYSHLTAVPAPATYRFERLPSQQAMNPQQSELEAQADVALHKAGFRRDDASPRYSVLVSARAQRTLSPYSDPWDYGWGWGGWGWGGGHRRSIGVGFGGPLFPRMDPPWYHREVSLVVRELASNRVVYETHAVNDGPWFDSRTVFPHMFEAALQGFPTPPAGPRRVDIRVDG
ncbi:MAG TPA: DUF4136 domain-containing protein [Ramlibacter sp.]|nr:DUF4136 domain-containing protein [Ramlibacter sp.]